MCAPGPCRKPCNAGLRAVSAIEGLQYRNVFSLGGVGQCLGPVGSPGSMVACGAGVAAYLSVATLEGCRVMI
jgi:hypothetical protein